MSYKLYRKTSVSSSTKILQHIAKSGRCDDLPIDACGVCPLAKLKKRPDGSGWLSCYDAIAAPNYENIKEKYKEAASNKLIDMAIEVVLADE